MTFIMRILKRILLGLFILITISVMGGYIYFRIAFKPALSQLTLLHSGDQIPFQWQSDTLNHELNPIAAMLLPITLEGCPKTFYMQFDIGAPTSLFYKNKLDAINNQYHNISLRHKNNKYKLENYQFMLGKTLVATKEIIAQQFDNTEIDWSDTTAKQIIGTIGTDLFENKTLIINYQKNYLLIDDKLPDHLSTKMKLSNFKFENRRILLPAILNGKEVDIFFDSGTSAFELMTDKKTWEELALKGAKVDRYPASSWNNQLTVNTVATSHFIRFNSHDFPLQHITYVEGTNFIQKVLMKLGGIGGLTGNKLFIGKIVILDTKNNKFAIID